MQLTPDQKVDVHRDQALEAEHSKSGWALAKHRYEVKTSGRWASLREYAQVLGKAREVIERYARAWERYAETAAVSIFDDAYELARTTEDKADDLLAEQKRQEEETGKRVPIRSLTRKEKTEAARELLADPEVREDPEVRDDIVEAASDDTQLAAQVDERWTEKHPAPRKKVEEPTGYDAAVDAGFSFAIRHAVEQASEAVQTTVAWLRRDDARHDGGWQQVIDEADSNLAWSQDRIAVYREQLRVAREGGVSDEALQSLLEGGS